MKLPLRWFLMFNLVLAVGARVAHAGVFVTDLPGGDKELTGVSATGVHVLRLSAHGTLQSWSDRVGNDFLQVLTSPSTWRPAALHVLGSDNTPILPADTASLEIQTVSPDEVRAIVKAPDGTKLIAIVQPQRVGLQVEGERGSYIVMGRIPAHLEGARVVSGLGTQYLSTGPAVLADTPQTLFDALHTRAFVLAAPPGLAVTWRPWQTDPWTNPTNKELAEWSVTVKPNETVWFSSGDLAVATGPAQVGLYHRRFFRPFGDPVAIATLSGTRLSATKPVTLSLSRPVDELIKDGIVLAALIPLTPDDPLESSERSPFYSRFDVYSSRLLPLNPQAVGSGWHIECPQGVSSGAYTLRLWVVPRATPLPEVLGGPKGAVVGYFPGFTGRGVLGEVTQSTPIGDVLVSVGTQSTGSLGIINPAQRASFWRGENIGLLVKARGTNDKLAATLDIRHRNTGHIIASSTIAIPSAKGTGAVEFTLDSTNLAPGEYLASARAAGLASYPYAFSVAPPRASGMPVIASVLDGRVTVEAYHRLGVSGSAQVLPFYGDLRPSWSRPTAGSQALAELFPSLPSGERSSGNDEAVADNWLFLQGMQGRQIGFGLPHSIPEQEAETFRKHLVYAQFGRRLPSTVGDIFNYDVAGVRYSLNFGSESYEAAQALRVKLMDAKWEEYWAKAKANGATEADKTRYQVGFSGGIFSDFYRRSITDLHHFVPEQRHSTAATLDHAFMTDGQYPPSIYEPLDFRYLEVWNDQMYLDSAHDMQESFWASLLRPQKPAGQPIWLTIPTGQQPGTHMRRSLEAIARGVSGIGYGQEGSAGLDGSSADGWGADPERSDIRAAQENLTGDMAMRYGTWFNAFRPNEQVALLYSASQGGTVFGAQSPLFYAYFTLAQLNRPARLVTEDEIAAGALKNVGALVIVRQTNALPAETTAAIEKFAAGGGKVLLDNDSTIAPKGAVKLTSVSWPPRTYGWANNYNAQLYEATARNREPLLAALDAVGRQPLEPTNLVPFVSTQHTFQVAPALVATKNSGSTQLVFVTSNQPFPMTEAFDEDARGGTFFHTFRDMDTLFYKDARVPRLVTLALRSDLAAKPPVVYDVFAGHGLPLKHEGNTLTVTVDLATLSGRVLLLTDRRIAAPELFIKPRTDVSALVTLDVKSAVPLPVKIEVGDQVVYRASNSTGTLETFALGPQSGKTPIQVTELASGQSRRTTLNLSVPVSASLATAPQVRIADATIVREVLASPDLAVYVDARQADTLADAKILATRLHAETVFNPPILSYLTGWHHPPDVEAANEKIVREKLLGWRVKDDYGLQWTGALKPAAVWNRPVILFGDAYDNKLLADLNDVSILARPALPEYLAPGSAWIQPVAAPFWNGAQAIVVLCADAAGRRAAFEKLAKLGQPKAEKSADFVSLIDDAPRAERRHLLGFADSQSAAEPGKLVALTSTAGHPGAVLQPVVPLSGLASIEGGVLATLHSPGNNFVRLDTAGKTVWRVPTAAFFQPQGVLANADGAAVTFDDRFTWRHDAAGKILWKALGTPLQAPDAKGALWLRLGTELQQIGGTGEILARCPFADSFLAASPDGRFMVLSRAGKAESRTKDTSSVVALSLPEGRELWSVADTRAAAAVISDDGRTVAVIEHEDFANRDDIEQNDASRLTAIDAATGKVVWSQPYGQSLNHLTFSNSGRQILVQGLGYTDWLLVADAQTGALRRIQLPEKGIWARAFSSDDTTLWLAAEKLYRVDLATLEVTPTYNGRLLQLLATNDGLWAAKPDATLLKLDRGGHTMQSTALLPGLAMGDVVGELKPLREARTVANSTLRTKGVNETFMMATEVPVWYMHVGDAVNFGDGAVPLEFTVRIPEKGRYRILLTPSYGQDQADKIGAYRLGTPLKRPQWLPILEKNEARSTPINGDPLHQVAELDLDAGIQDIEVNYVAPWESNTDTDWGVTPTLRTVTVEKTN